MAKIAVHGYRCEPYLYEWVPYRSWASEPRNGPKCKSPIGTRQGELSRIDCFWRRQPRRQPTLR